MQELIGGYSRWRNHRHGERGNLFRSRFWSKIVRNKQPAARDRSLHRAQPCGSGHAFEPGGLALEQLSRAPGPRSPSEIPGQRRIPELLRARSQPSSRRVRAVSPRRSSRGQDEVSPAPC
jgi:hypothetical protein